MPTSDSVALDRKKKTSLLVLTVSFSLLLGIACKPSRSSELKTIVGEDARGISHSLRFLPAYRNQAVANGPNTLVAVREEQVIRSPVMAFIECDKTARDEPETIMDGLEIAAFSNRLIVDSKGHLVMSDNRVPPCRVIGSALLSYPMLAFLFRQVEGMANQSIASEQSDSARFIAAQAVYLALRGPLDIRRPDQLGSALVLFLPWMAALQSGLTLTPKDAARQFASMDQTFNPCLKSTVAAFSRWKQMTFNCASHRQVANLKVYGINVSRGTSYEKVRSIIASEISNLRDTLHPLAKDLPGARLMRRHTAVNASEVKP